MSEKENQFPLNVDGGNDMVTKNKNVGLASVAAIPIPTPNMSVSGSLLDLMQPLVDFQEIQFKEKVGHGSYGVVYKAVWHDRLVAVKEFEPNSDLKAIETEVKQLSRVSHHNIISLFGISTNKQSKYLIMEYAEGGSLHNFLHGKVKPFYSTAHGMSWASQCAEGVAYLHAMKPKPLIHRDLKPLNLLLTNKGRLLKICDFGTVADKSTLMTNNKGSAAWMAPEVFVGSKYTEKCDVFSWAIVLWEVLSRQRPFKEADNNYAIMWKIHKGERPPPIKDCPDQITKLMTSCWSNAPESRPSMQFVVSIMNELLSHFQGALEPLNYEIVDQQIICTNSNSNTLDKYTLDFSSLNTSSTNCEKSFSSQLTATNICTHINDCISSTPINADNINATNSQNDVPTYPNTSQWDVIVEEPETSNPTGQMTTDPFKFQPSQEKIGRYKVIQSGIREMSGMLMTPLAVEVDSNAWDLPKTDYYKFDNTDDKERFIASNPTLVLPINTSNIINSNSSNTNKMTDTITHLLNNEEDVDEEEIDGSTMLDPELQPESPICGNSESEQIYREHQRLATEYLLVDTKLSYAQVFKDNLLAEMNPIERQNKQELLKKINEKEDLLGLYNNLKQQLEKINKNPFESNCGSGTSIGNVTSGEIVADDGWVMIPPQQNI